MRAVLLIALLVACGDDDMTLGFDAAVEDTGTDSGSDAGFDSGFDAGTDSGSDAGTDSGFDAGVDSGFDAGPATCTPEAPGITFPSGTWNAVVAAEGAALDQPVSVDFDGDRLLVSNSASWLVISTAAGNILEVEGTVGVLASGASFLGPSYVAWNTGADGFAEGLYVSIEDAAGPGILAVSPDGSSVSTLGNATEPGEIEFGPGGAWGGQLYVPARERADAVMPNPFEVYRYDATGMRTRVAITVGGAPLVGAFVLEFGPGGALGTDLYVGTVMDTGFSPGSIPAIYRVAADGTATEITRGFRPFGIAAPAMTAGPFGEFLYVSNGTGITRVDADGTAEMFAETLTATASLRFGPDGSLYLAEPGEPRVLQISPCP
ncbi:MAG: hypothetical protein AAGE52_02390 [Myxococcota bacterium]